MLSDFIFLVLVCIATYIILSTYLSKNNINLIQLINKNFTKSVKDEKKEKILNKVSEKTSSSYEVSQNDNNDNNQNNEENFISVDTDEIINEVINNENQSINNEVVMNN
jgi:hypothetical protein